MQFKSSWRSSVQAVQNCSSLEQPWTALNSLKQTWTVLQQLLNCSRIVQAQFQSSWRSSKTVQELLKNSSRTVPQLFSNNSGSLLELYLNSFWTGLDESIMAWGTFPFGHWPGSSVLQHLLKHLAAFMNLFHFSWTVLVLEQFKSCLRTIQEQWKNCSWTVQEQFKTVQIQFNNCSKTVHFLNCSRTAQKRFKNCSRTVGNCSQNSWRSSNLIKNVQEQFFNIQEQYLNCSRVVFEPFLIYSLTVLEVLLNSSWRVLEQFKQ